MRSAVMSSFSFVSLVSLAALPLGACGGDDGATPGADGGVDAAAPFTPQPTGTCPTIRPGDVMFAPLGIAPRAVRLSLREEVATGPLVVYWHATGSTPAEAQYSFGAVDEAAFLAAGGVIAAPYSDPAAGMFEWFVVNQRTEQDDFLLADEIVACLAKAGRIDMRHVHSWGMSAGALQTTAMSFLRSSYLASVATYSGGVPAGFTTPPPLDPDNRFAAMIFHGGASDMVFGVDFQAASETYRALLDDADHFTTVCNHGGGHSIPRAAAPSVLRFFADNGFGASPSPYQAAGLPADFPAYCTR
jgi:predicted esterase